VEALRDALTCTCVLGVTAPQLYVMPLAVVKKEAHTMSAEVINSLIQVVRGVVVECVCLWMWFVLTAMPG
jgi:hypothetical protein